MRSVHTVSNAFARICGGTLSVESTLGVGSTFTLRMPVRILDTHELEVAVEATATAAATELARLTAAHEQQRDRAVSRAAVAAAAAAAATASGEATAQVSKRPHSPSSSYRILVAVRPPALRAARFHATSARATDASHVCANPLGRLSAELAPHLAPAAAARLRRRRRS